MELNKFCRLNQSIKTCSLELVPIGRTRETIEKHNVIEEDSKRKENAVLAKEVSDSFIREFIADYKGDFDWSELVACFGKHEEYAGIKEKMEEKIARKFSDAFNDYISKFLKANGVGKADDKTKWSDASYIDVVLPLYASLHPDYDNPKYKEAIASICHCSSTIFKRYITAYEKIINGTKKGSFAERVMDNFQIICTNRLMCEIVFSKIKKADDFRLFLDAPEAMNEYLSQKGINQYNETIGDSFSEKGEIIRYGLNHYINEWNQKNPDSRMPKLQKLKKQILSVAEPAFRIDVIDNEKELQETIKNIRAAEVRYSGKLKDILENLNYTNTYIHDGVLVKAAGRENLAKMITGEWNFFREQIREREERRIRDEYLQKKNRIKTKLTKKDEKQIEDTVSKGMYSLVALNKMLGEEKTSIESKLLDEYVKNRSEREKHYTVVANADFMSKESLPTSDEIKIIQNYLDKVIQMTHIIRCLDADAQNEKVDLVFLEDAAELEDDKTLIVTGYNLIRNFLTKKREKTAKEKAVQLCFGRPAHFEQKWNNKQAGKFGNVDAALLEENGKFYYIVPAAKNESKLNFPVTDEPQAGRCYNYLSTQKAIGFAKAFAKFTIKSPEAMSGYAKSEEPFEISVGNQKMTVSKKMYDSYEAKTFRDSEEEKIKLIDYAKEFLQKHGSYNTYDWSELRESKDYVNYGEFCSEVDSIAFRVVNRYISKDLVDDAVLRGDLYMFEITSQDMYKDKNRMKNIMALRFHAIMEGMKTGNKSIIINNAPQIRYRPQIIEAEDKHPAGSKLVNKKTTDGKTIPSDIYLELCDFYNGRKSSLSPEASLYNERVSVKVSDREHIKDKHYTAEKFLITLSYTMNKNVASNTSVYKLNEMIRNEIKENGCNIMSVIRGIDNLLYYAVIDENGNKIEAGDLNVVGDTDFNEMLSVVSKQRYIDQKNWKYEKKVAELKDTYLGQACRKIASIAVKNNAVIVIDKINENTKRKNAAFDNNVYRKFEDALVNTLSNYYDRSIKADEPGGISNPLQLCVNEDNNFQNGILFYTYDAFTKNICMDTGFINLLNTFNVKTVAAKLGFLKKMDGIYYDSDRQEFVFEFAWGKLGSVLKEEEAALYTGLDKNWKVRTHLTRYKRDRESGKYKEVDGTEILKKMIKEKHPDMIGEKINVDKLTSNEVQTVYEIFTLYVNGFIPRMDGESSEYMSPVSDWNSLNNITYDEMTALQLARKGSLTIGRIKNGFEGKDINISRVDWLNEILR